MMLRDLLRERAEGCRRPPSLLSSTLQPYAMAYVRPELLEPEVLDEACVEFDDMRDVAPKPVSR